MWGVMIAHSRLHSGKGDTFFVWMYQPLNVGPISDRFAAIAIGGGEN